MELCQLPCQEGGGQIWVVRPWGLQMPLTTAFLPQPPASPSHFGLGQARMSGEHVRGGVGAEAPALMLSFLLWLLLAWQFIVMSRGTGYFSSLLGEGGSWLLSSQAVVCWRLGVWRQDGGQV